MRSLCLGLLLFLGGALSAQAAIIAKEVEYKANGTAMKGYLAYDDKIEGKRPGVLVVHEWWGLNEYSRKRARMLAELGYTALALDMYGDGKQAHHPEEANKFSSELMKNQDAAKARFEAAHALLAKQDTVDPKRIAAIGYCFGGTVVLEMARSGAELNSVVSFHGNLGTTTPAKPGAVKAKVLVLTGADDPFVPAEQVERFKKEMDAASVNYKLVVYPGAKHGFTNPDATEFGKKFKIPLEYDKAADEASWKEMQVFFDEQFK